MSLCSVYMSKYNILKYMAGHKILDLERKGPANDALA